MSRIAARGECVIDRVTRLDRRQRLPITKSVAGAASAQIDA
jgi:hypothetical protein